MPQKRLKTVFACLVSAVLTANFCGYFKAWAEPLPDSKLVAKRVSVKKTMTFEPTPNPRLTPPVVKPGKGAEEEILPDFTPATLPKIKFPEQVSPTPTPEPGLHPKDPTVAAFFSAIVPGLGHVYSGEPIKGIFFTAAFSLSLWQCLENFKLHPVHSGSIGDDIRESKNETAGSLYGLAALAAYGFGVQDAYNSAKRYNRRHYLNVTLSFGFYPSVGLQYTF